MNHFWTHIRFYHKQSFWKGSSNQSSIWLSFPHWSHVARFAQQQTIQNACRVHDWNARHGNKYVGEISFARQRLRLKRSKCELTLPTCRSFHPYRARILNSWRTFLPNWEPNINVTGSSPKCLKSWGSLSWWCSEWCWVTDSTTHHGRLGPKLTSNCHWTWSRRNLNGAPKETPECVSKRRITIMRQHSLIRRLHQNSESTKVE